MAKNAEEIKQLREKARKLSCDIVVHLEKSKIEEQKLTDMLSEFDDLLEIINNREGKSLG
jgi:arsenate reductase-like glutaredoxin family protein|tara:strand:+ start:464 stop:643 length:180 start_codon:yes stop_codon:yes gene_type:complete